MNIERLLLCLLLLYLLHLLYQQHRTRLRRLLQRSKDRLPRTWKPKSPRDCACCQTGVSLVPPPDPNSVVPWSQRKSTRGTKKTVDIVLFGYFGTTCIDRILRHRQLFEDIVAERVFWAYQRWLFQNTMMWGILFEKRGGFPWKSNGKLIEPGYGVYSKNTLIGPTPSWLKKSGAV